MDPSFSDFRSDTVTHPTEAMRRSVLDAALGDDVIGADPTVIALQERAADLCGMEAAVFVASGTMANLVALACHCQPGDEVILGRSCHIFNNEAGGIARIVGASPHTLDDDDGLLPLAGIEGAIRADREHHARTRLVCTESTHNAAGGVVVPLEHLRAIRTLARSRGLGVHLDGARLFNASVASGAPVRDIAATADSVSFCLSKGLSCPGGSLLVGERDFIREARRVRKVLGGGMRQVGFLAAPGLVALEQGIDRLAEDHARCRTLAEGIAHLPGIRVDLERVQTNILYIVVECMPAQALVDELAQRKVACMALTGRVRLVTHRQVTDADVQRAIDAFCEILGS